MANRDESLISRIVAALPLYVVYFFVSGWAYNDFYFRSFSIDTRILDIGFYDTIVRGFTIAVAGASWLWLVYLLLFAVPLFLDRCVRTFGWKAVLMLISLAALLMGDYYLSRSFGQSKANIDKGEGSTLPAITFSVNKDQLVGKLVFLRGDLLFVDQVRPQGTDTTTHLELSVFKTSEVSNLIIIEHK